jgi:hypothetical protein
VLDAAARLLVPRRADQPLDRRREHDVCVVVEGLEAADERAAVGGYYEDFSWWRSGKAGWEAGWAYG